MSTAAHHKFALAFACAALLAGPAFAETAAGEKAHDLQAAGFKALKAKKYTEAIQDFEGAYALSGHALLLGMISRAHLEQGHCSQAVESADQYVAAATQEDSAAADKVHAQVLEECIRVQLDSDPPGAAISVDANVVHKGEGPWRGWLLAGEHRLGATLAGSTLQQRLAVPAGSKPMVVTLAFPSPPFNPAPAAITAKPPPAQPPAPRPAAGPANAPPKSTAIIATHVEPAAPPRIAPAAVIAAPPPSQKSHAPPLASDLLFGVAAAGVAVAIAEGIQTNNCASGVINPVQISAVSDCQSTHAKLANYAWIGAGAFAAAGGVVWIVHATSDGEQHGVALAGRF
jgi:hypothetical protein